MTIWDSFKKIIIISSSERISHPDEFRVALENYWENKVEIMLILIYNSKKPKDFKDQNSSIISVFQKEIGLFGKLKNENFNSLKEKSHDAVLICGEFKGKMKKQIRLLKSDNFIGINTEDDIYEINLQMESNEPLEMVNFAQSIVSKITKK